MTPVEIRLAYARGLSLYEGVQLRRYTGTGRDRLPVDTPVRARVIEYKPDELIGGIVQGERRVLVLAEDVENSAFTVPFVVTSDKLVIRGVEFTIKSVDDNTRRYQGVLMAYDIRVGG